LPWSSKALAGIMASMLSAPETSATMVASSATLQEVRRGQSSGVRMILIRFHQPAQDNQAQQCQKDKIWHMQTSNTYGDKR
jgi:hypothetical protein